VNSVEGRSADEIFGGTDSLKFRSSMTLFMNSTQNNDILILRYTNIPMTDQTKLRLSACEANLSTNFGAIDRSTLPKPIATRPAVCRGHSGDVAR
jgi:hypothetical protein